MASIAAAPKLNWARVVLGRALKQMREEAGVALAEVAKACEMSESTLWRMETAQTASDVHKVRALCRYYGVDADMTEELARLAKESARQGWWQALGDTIHDELASYIAMEDAAVAAGTCHHVVVPGLLQTEDYARTLLSLSPGIGPDDVERGVRVRATRQDIVTRAENPLHLDAVLSEAVLARPVGGTRVMAAQLSLLAELSGLPSVSIRVIPLGAPLGAGMLAGSFTILRFPEAGGWLAGQPPTVFIEEFTGMLCPPDQAAASYVQAFSDLSDICLDSAESRQMIINRAKEMQS